jgi:hypothetical protein
MSFYIPDPDFFAKNIDDAKVIMHTIDFFSKNNFLDDVEKWKNRLLHKLELVNNDEYFNYDFFSTSQKDAINKNASKYFIHDPKRFQEFLKVSLSIESKIKPENNKFLRQSNQNSFSSNPIEADKSQKENSLEEFRFLVSDFSIERKDYFLAQFKQKLTNSSEPVEFVREISDAIHNHNENVVPTLFNLIIECLNSFYFEQIKSQYYEKASETKTLIKLFNEQKVVFDLTFNRSFQDLLPEITTLSFDIFLRKDFKKGIEFLNELVIFDKEHKLLLELGKYYAKLSNLRYYIQSNYDINSLVVIFLNLKIYKNDQKNLFIAFFFYNLGNLNYAQNYINKIKSLSLKKEFFDSIWMVSFNKGDYEFLIENLPLWINEDSCLETFIQMCINKGLESYTNRIFELSNKVKFFEKVVKIFFYQNNENLILDFSKKYPNYINTIDTILDRLIENHLDFEIGNSINQNSCVKIFEYLKKYPIKSLYIEKKVANYLQHKQKNEFDNHQLMNDEDLIILITLFHSNYEILKYSIFEKAKRILVLNEENDFNELLNSILDLEVWKLSIQK